MKHLSQTEWCLIFASYVIFGLISYGLVYYSDKARYERKKPGYRYEDSRRRANRKGWYFTIFLLGPIPLLWRASNSIVKTLF
jgi:hypothetical protein